MKTVRQSSKDPISYRLVVDFDEVTLTAASCAIYSPAGSELRADSAVDVTRSVGLATFTPSAGWEDSTYPVDRSFRVRWTLTAGGIEYIRDDFFDVTLRDFASEVTDADVARIESSVTSKLGVSTLKDLRREAWGEIAQEVSAVLKANPAITASGSQFRLCHIYLVLAMFYRRERFGTLGAESEAAWKADHYEKEYRRALSRALNNLNSTDYDDNVVSSEQQSRTWPRMRFLK
jgi:hypothetical protein